MKRCLAVFVFVSVICILAVPSARGAGFLIFEQGAKAMGMAGAFTATADDPSAIFNNPAGITQLEGTQISIGNTFIRNDQKLDVDSDAFAGVTYHEEMASQTFYLPHLYLTHALNDNMTIGFGLYNPFGIGTDWPDNSVGNSVANEASLKTYDFNPNIAYKVNPKLSLAFGVHYVRTNLQIIRNVGAESFISAITPVTSYDTFLGQNQFGRLKIDARGGGWAYNLGVLYKLNEFWKAGFSYRGHTKIEIARSRSTVKWTPSTNTLSALAAVNPLLGSLSFNPLVSTTTEGYTRINLPGIFLAGISTTAIPDWTFDFDVQYTTWNHFDDVDIQVEPPLNLNSGVAALGLPTTSNGFTLEEDWENSWGLHLGTEYKYTDNFAVRAGYFFDKNPIPDRTLGPILPDSDRHNFSLGCGYTMGTWTFDTAYMYSHFKDRNTTTNYQNFNADYKTDFHLLGITVTKKL